MASTGEQNLSWYQGLTRYHWWVLIVAISAWMFDCMDQRLFILSRAPAIKELAGWPEREKEILPDIEKEAAKEVQDKIDAGELKAKQKDEEIALATRQKTTAVYDKEFKGQVDSMGDGVTALMMLGWAVGGAVLRYLRRPAGTGQNAFDYYRHLLGVHGLVGHGVHFDRVLRVSLPGRVRYRRSVRHLGHVDRRDHARPLPGNRAGSLPGAVGIGQHHRLVHWLVHLGRHEYQPAWSAGRGWRVGMASADADRRPARHPGGNRDAHDQGARRLARRPQVGHQQRRPSDGRHQEPLNQFPLAAQHAGGTLAGDNRRDRPVGSGILLARVDRRSARRPPLGTAEPS